MKLGILGILLWSASAYADPPADAALYSTVGWGQTVVAQRASVTTQAGYDGTQQRAQATGIVEVGLIPHLAVFAGVTYGEEAKGASRPTVGAAYQLLDPHLAPVGLRISTAYKPEGFSEPEGEIESVLTASRLFAHDVARSFVAYGTDPDGKESDVELGAGYLHRVATHWVVGATTRYRYAIAMKTPSGPRWDLIGGAVGDLVVDRWRLELLVGGGAAGTAYGPLGLLSVGIDL